MADDENSTKKPDYWWRTIDPLWRLTDPLTVLQAAALITGVDPSGVHISDWGVPEISWERSGDKAYHERRLKAAFEALRNAVNAGVLAATLRHRGRPDCSWFEPPPPDGGQDGNEEEGFLQGDYYIIKDPAWDMTTVTVADLTEWLERKGIRTGFFFSNGRDDVPEYLDPKHPRYAPKLAAAVRAWEAVTDPGGRSAKDALTKWLREHAATFGLTRDNGTLNETGIGEAAKVANWQLSGGAPKTPGG